MSNRLLEWPSMAVAMELPFEIDGPRFEVTFPADSIDNIQSFWLLVGVLVLFGEPLTRMWTDPFDPDAGAPGQVITSIPWSPEE